MPVACTRTSTSPGPTCGIGASSKNKCSGPPRPCVRIAFTRPPWRVLSRDTAELTLGWAGLEAYPTVLSLAVIGEHVPLILARNVALMTGLALFGVQLVDPALVVEVSVSPAVGRTVETAVFHHDANHAAL